MKFNLEQDKCHVMGILNVTPDSFFDGGKYSTLDKVMVRVNEMITEGVDIIDIGGESSRPGSDRISIQEELDRIMPVVSKIRDNYDIPISIDSMKSDVVEELLPFNINIINDISSLSDDNFINILKKTDAYICLMHMIEDPSTMQNNPSYRNVTEEVFKYLKDKSRYCIENGIDPKKIIIDPGFGFGKTLDHNYELLKNLDKFIEINTNILVGISRKSMIGNLLNQGLDKRLFGSLSAAVISLIKHAKIIRTHDIRETKIAIDIIESLI
jgi:dihydropteroate synthase|tara:strand:- start:241 stop:1047 length:807 start_codon:yes stop_codon:yes gene_type:complete